MHMSRWGERVRLLRSPASIEESYKYETGFWIAAQIVSFMPIALGCTILAGGHDRFMSPVFRIPGQLMPHWGWGMTFVFLGVGFAMMVFRRCQNTLYWGTLLSWLYIFFAACQALSSILPGIDLSHPKPTITGIPTYLCLGILTMFVSMVAGSSIIDRHVAWVRSKIRRD